MDLLSPGQRIPYAKSDYCLPNPSTSSLMYRKIIPSVFSAAGLDKDICSWREEHWETPQGWPDATAGVQPSAPAETITNDSPGQETHTLKRKMPLGILFHTVVNCQTSLWDSAHAHWQEQVDRRRQSPQTWQGQWKTLACVACHNVLAIF